MTHAVFVFFALMAVGSAIFCVTQRNPVAAIMWLIITMLSLAGIFVLLGAQFAGVMQVLVYAGAILVLFMFFVMLLQLRHHDSDIRGKLGWMLALGIAGALLTQLAVLKGYTPGRMAEEISRTTVMANPAFILPHAKEVQSLSDSRGVVGAVAEPMFTRWLVPFELTSVLLLAAMVGAVVIAKRRV